MKKTLALILLFSGFLSAQERNITVLKSGWKFQLGNTPNAQTEKLDDSKWASVSVPHDWAIAGLLSLMAMETQESSPGKEKVGTD